MLEEIVDLLREFPSPKKTWKVIINELLLDSNFMRELGSETMLAGAIMKTLKSSPTDEQIGLIQRLADLSWEFYTTHYGNTDALNFHRLSLEESVHGLLLAGKRGRSPSTDSMVKKAKAFSMSREAWEWLESQENQSEVLRKAIEDAMSKA